MLLARMVRRRRRAWRRDAGRGDGRGRAHRGGRRVQGRRCRRERRRRAQCVGEPALQRLHLDVQVDNLAVSLGELLVEGEEAGDEGGWLIGTRAGRRSADGRRDAALCSCAPLAAARPIWRERWHLEGEAWRRAAQVLWRVAPPLLRLLSPPPAQVHWPREHAHGGRSMACERATPPRPLLALCSLTVGALVAHTVHLWRGAGGQVGGGAAALNGSMHEPSRQAASSGWRVWAVGRARSERLRSREVGARAPRALECRAPLCCSSGALRQPTMKRPSNRRKGEDDGGWEAHTATIVRVRVTSPAHTPAAG